jgi:hypothetical protein
VPSQTPGAANLATVSTPAADQANAANAQAARLRFEPQTINLTPGQTATLGISVDNVNDLYSIPMILQ